ncbi:hypothetical protein J2X14_004137 [Pantoea alhagi]|nr:hypothetical protein [Pantoea alhagi]
MRPAKPTFFYPVCDRARQKSKRFGHPIPARPADTICFVIILRAQLTGSGDFLSFMPLRSKETDIFLTCLPVCPFNFTCQNCSVRKNIYLYTSLYKIHSKIVSVQSVLIQ